MLILASSSPYRRAQLEQLGLRFSVESPRVDEAASKARMTDPKELCTTLAHAKALDVFDRNPNAVVIGGDQLVDFKGALLGKPGSKAKAVEQLWQMNGQSHLLWTAVCIVSEYGAQIHVDRTVLTMRTLERDALERYVDLDEPTDCAGSYKFERGGVGLFERVESRDPTAIMGLPMLAVVRMLVTAGVMVP